jgi:signal transduction histidine kinase
MKIQFKMILIVAVSVIISPFIPFLIGNLLIDYIEKSYTSYDLEKISIEIMKKINDLTEYDEESIKKILKKEKERDGNIDFAMTDEFGKPFFSTFIQKETRTIDFNTMIEEDEKYIERESGKNLKFVKYFDQRDYLVIKPIVINEEIKGQFIVMVKKEFILPFYIGINRDKAFMFYLMSFISFLSTVIISFLLVFFFTIPLIKRMKNLYNRINGYKPDGPVKRINDRGKDEIGVISGTFDMMTERMNLYYVEQRKFYQQRQDLFRNISHDFRTPLTSILGYATTLDERLFENDEDAAICSRIIRKKAEYMTDLFNEMMELYRLDSDIATIRKMPFNIAELVRELVIEYIPQFEKEGFYYDIDIPDVIIINGDREKLSRAIRNLIDNVMKHGNSGKYFGITVCENKDNVKISVKDKGEGIAGENIEKIFEWFFRTSKKSGMGLGLSIAKEIVERHEGKISVTSNLSSGSEFSMILPIMRS